MQIYSNLDLFTHKASLKAGFSISSQNTDAVQKDNLNQDNLIQNNLNQNLLQVKNIEENREKNKEKKQNEDISNTNWYIEIPIINLKAKIAEGTTKEVMDKYVGHFEDTQKTYGNIGLAAHNRGYEKNYFADLKKLKVGDKIIYRYENFTKEYSVTKHYIIKDTDWTNLENTEENRITLITCVENQKEYRRCIQGEENK